MKINQDIHIGRNQAQTRQVQQQATNNFGSLVVKQGQKMQTEQLTRLLGDISTAGERITK